MRCSIVFWSAVGGECVQSPQVGEKEYLRVAHGKSGLIPARVFVHVVRWPYTSSSRKQKIEDDTIAYAGCWCGVERSGDDVHGYACLSAACLRGIVVAGAESENV